MVLEDKRIPPRRLPSYHCIALHIILLNWIFAPRVNECIWSECFLFVAGMHQSDCLLSDWRHTLLTLMLMLMLILTLMPVLMLTMVIVMILMYWWLWWWWFWCIDDDDDDDDDVCQVWLNVDPPHFELPPLIRTLNVCHFHQNRHCPHFQYRHYHHLFFPHIDIQYCIFKWLYVLYKSPVKMWMLSTKNEGCA